MGGAAAGRGRASRGVALAAAVVPLLALGAAAPRAALGQRADTAPCDTSRSVERCELRVEYGAFRRPLVRGVYRDRVCADVRDVRACDVATFVRRDSAAREAADAAHRLGARGRDFGYAAGVTGLAAVTGFAVRLAPAFLGGSRAGGPAWVGTAAAASGVAAVGFAFAASGSQARAAARRDEALRAYNAGLTARGEAVGAAAPRPGAAAPGVCDTSSSYGLCALRVERRLFSERITRGTAALTVARQAPDGSFDVDRVLARSPEAAALAAEHRRRMRWAAATAVAGMVVIAAPGPDRSQGARDAAGVTLAGAGLAQAVLARPVLRRALRAYNAELRAP